MRIVKKDQKDSYISYSIKLKEKRPLSRQFFTPINEFISNISIFYDLTKMSFHAFLNAIKQNPNLYFTTIKDSVQYTTLKELKNKSK